MKLATSKIVITAALCLVTVVSYVFAGAQGAGSFGPRNKPGLHKKSPNGKQNSRSNAHGARGSKGQSGSTQGDSIPTSTPTPTPTPTPTLNA
jgi:hypothetical protein